MPKSPWTLVLFKASMNIFGPCQMVSKEPSIKDILVWTKSLMDILDRTKCLARSETNSWKAGHVSLLRIRDLLSSRLVFCIFPDGAVKESCLNNTHFRACERIYYKVLGVCFRGKHPFQPLWILSDSRVFFVWLTKTKQVTRKTKTSFLWHMSVFKEILVYSSYFSESWFLPSTKKQLTGW